MKPAWDGLAGSGRLRPADAGVDSLIETFAALSVHPGGLGWGLAGLGVWAWFGWAERLDCMVSRTFDAWRGQQMLCVLICACACVTGCKKGFCFKRFYNPFCGSRRVKYNDV